MKRFAFACMAATIVGWNNSSMAQELRQGTPVTPSSVYVYEVSGTNYNEVREDTVVSIQDGRANLQEVRITKDKKLTRTRILDLASHSMPWSHTIGAFQFVRFPANVGDVWKWTASEGQDGASDPVRHTYDVSAKFVGWEDVEVPAGKFRVAKIEHVGTMQRNVDPAPSQYTATIWYSPELGCLVKRTQANVWRGGSIAFEMRLASYRLAPADSSKK